MNAHPIRAGARFFATGYSLEGDERTQLEIVDVTDDLVKFRRVDGTGRFMSTVDSLMERHGAQFGEPEPERKPRRDRSKPYTFAMMAAGVTLIGLSLMPGIQHTYPTALVEGADCPARSCAVLTVHKDLDAVFEKMHPAPDQDQCRAMEQRNGDPTLVRVFTLDAGAGTYRAARQAVIDKSGVCFEPSFVASMNDPVSPPVIQSV